MSNARLHAYEVLLRVARVREIRASLAQVEALTEERTRRKGLEKIGTARMALLAASHAVEDGSKLDVARYELLSILDATLGAKLQVASSQLTAAEKVSKERGAASVLAKRYREKICDKVSETSDAIDRKCSTSQQEMAIELWLESGTR
ncbi:MAG: hypothetical protein ABI114_01695 [Rhodanobacter sp.]